MIKTIREFFRRLSARIILLMTLALLPLGFISVYQTGAVVNEAQRLGSAAVRAKTIAAASAERQLIQEAVGAAKALAVAIAGEPETCGRLTRDFVNGENPYIFAGFTSADGVMRCSSTGDTVDFSDNPAFFKALNSTGTTISLSRQGAVTGQSVMLVSAPARRNGVPFGLVTLSIPHWISTPLAEIAAQDFESGLRMASVNMDGAIVSSSSNLDDAPSFLPRDTDLTELASRTGESFIATAGNGEDRFFSITNMIEGELFLVGSWPVSVAGQPDFATARAFAIGFPILMWIAGIGVAYFGLQRLFVRHVRTLRSSMRRFALGDRAAPYVFSDDAPEELAEAERAFSRMATIIIDAENRQKDDLRDKEILLKEVHHRVKNNLQMIASIMNMQARVAKERETRQMLSSLQRRVRGLALLHRSLYTTPDVTHIDAAEMVRLVLADASEVARQRNIEVKTELDSVRLLPDQAVPLSMLVSEAVTNAIKHQSPARDGESYIHVSLKLNASNRLFFQIKNTTADEKERPEGADDLPELSGDGLGKRLMSAFVLQLGAETEAVHEDGSYTFSVSLPVGEEETRVALAAQ